MFFLMLSFYLVIISLTYLVLLFLYPFYHYYIFITLSTTYSQSLFLCTQLRVSPTLYPFSLHLLISSYCSIIYLPQVCHYSNTVVSTHPTEILFTYTKLEWLNTYNYLGKKPKKKSVTASVTNTVKQILSTISISISFILSIFLSWPVLSLLSWCWISTSSITLLYRKVRISVSPEHDSVVVVIPQGLFLSRVL